MIEFGFYLAEILVLVALANSNPVHSLLCLIFLFMNGVIWFFISDVEYIGVCFLIIYVGAILTLFLFVVMIINVQQNISSGGHQSTNLTWFIFLPLVLVVVTFIFMSYSVSVRIKSSAFFLDSNFLPFSNFGVISSVLYQHFSVPILFIAFLLFVAMVGAIFLTSVAPLFVKKQQLTLQQNKAIVDSLRLFYLCILKQFCPGWRIVWTSPFLYSNWLMFRQSHPYHLVTPSPWPILTAICAFLIPLGAVQYMHFYTNGFWWLLFGLVSTFACMAFWWRDVIREATFEGMHTDQVQTGLRLGFVLFIASEVMFFFAFFWAFFHSSLAPTVEIGCVWPPVGIVPFNPWGVPLLNTYILLLSGVTITIVHHSLIEENPDDVKINFLKTIGLALTFTVLQAFEYIEAPFTISDGIYGSTFFMATGFHGAHVIIGTIFITVAFIRAIFEHFTSIHHIGFEAAAWYWHFVDVVWLFLFVSIYWWGSILNLSI